jgi:hypothetical protein
MYKRLFLLIALVWLPSAFCNSARQHVNFATDSRFSVKISKNVELLGFVYFLGYEGAQAQTEGYSTKTKARYAYGLNLYEHYKAHANSKHLAIVIGFAQDIWLDYFISLLVQLDDFPNAKLHDGINKSYYLRFSASKDPKEAKRNVTTFIDAMNALYREVDFDHYFKQNQDKYDSALNQVKAGLPDSLFLPAMEKFYQKRFNSYNLVPSLTIPPGMGFGVSHSNDAFHVFGAFAPPVHNKLSGWDMGFGDKKHLLELSTHEFGHSFVNPVVDAFAPELIISTEVLFDPIREVMSNQGYTVWKACVYEHFVRAGEVVIAQILGRQADADRLRAAYMQDRKFIYLPVLLPELESYNRHRNSTYSEAAAKAMQRLVETAIKR